MKTNIDTNYQFESYAILDVGNCSYPHAVLPCEIVAEVRGHYLRLSTTRDHVPRV